MNLKNFKILILSKLRKKMSRARYQNRSYYVNVIKYFYRERSLNIYIFIYKKAGYVTFALRRKYNMAKVYTPLWSLYRKVFTLLWSFSQWSCTFFRMVGKEDWLMFEVSRKRRFRRRRNSGLTQLSETSDAAMKDVIRRVVFNWKRKIYTSTIKCEWKYTRYLNDGKDWFYF